MGTCLGWETRPASNLLQGLDERGRRGPKIDVLHMEDLHPGTEQHAVRIGVGAGIAPQPPQDLPRTGISIMTSLRIVEDIQLDLAHALGRELLGERRMRVVECLCLMFAGRRDQCPHGGQRGHVVRVVRADHLDLVPANLIVRKCKAIGQDRRIPGSGRTTRAVARAMEKMSRT